MPRIRISGDTDQMAKAKMALWCPLCGTRAIWIDKGAFKPMRGWFCHECRVDLDTEHDMTAEEYARRYGVA